MKSLIMMSFPCGCVEEIVHMNSESHSEFFVNGQFRKIVNLLVKISNWSNHDKLGVT